MILWKKSTDNLPSCCEEKKLPVSPEVVNELLPKIIRSAHF